jgi:2-succinyl-5-enolpyruvyl-6-hydroxy-3-cyclohexene-1-carboxylate synthase
VVLRFGGVPTSKALQQALAEWRCPQVLFATPGTWPDPSWSATDVVFCDPVAAAVALAFPLRARARGGDSAWSALWSKSSSTVRKALDAMLDRLPAVFEGRIARDLTRHLPEHGLFFVGNSTPIRDVDTFSARTPRQARVLANRGANGIDGVLSTALGAAAGAARPTVLLLGDLSFLHDVGALQVGARLGIPLLVVVVNNDGGGIFHTLPAAALGERFERCFTTPHGLDLSASAPAGVAGSCEIRRAATGAELESLLDGWLAAPRPLVLEVPSDRREAAATRSALLSDAVAGLARGGDFTA